MSSGNPLPASDLPATLRVAQLTLFTDTSGSLHAEAPGASGGRRKIELAARSSDSLEDIIRANAWLIAEEIRGQIETEAKRKQALIDRERKLAQERHLRIIEYTAAHHPRQLHLVDPNWRNAVDRRNARDKKEKAEKAAKRAKAKRQPSPEQTALSNALRTLVL